MTTATPTSSQQAPFGDPNPYATNTAPAAESSGFSIASLVLGLVSIVAALHVLRADRRPRARHHGAAARARLAHDGDLGHRAEQRDARGHRARRPRLRRLRPRDAALRLPLTHAPERAAPPASGRGPFRCCRSRAPGCRRRRMPRRPRAIRSGVEAAQQRLGALDVLGHRRGRVVGAAAQDRADDGAVLLVRSARCSARAAGCRRAARSRASARRRRAG